MKSRLLLIAALIVAAAGCSSPKIDVIFDTDANNELDDQHAIAYLLLNQDVFNIYGITTNVTINGGIEAQCEEVERVAALVDKKARILPGAEAKFEDIKGSINNPTFDGSEAVNFIIETARKHSPKDKLTIIPVGKLTNIALALAKAPEIAPNIRIVWLGSNYPDGGEHNLRCDIPSMNYVLDTEADFEMVVCRYGKPSGTSAVKVSIDEVRERFAGKGPKAAAPVTGRHGGEFTCFGDYSVNLFENIHLDNGYRSLFDLVTVAITKNPEWGQVHQIPAPTMIDGKWVERPDNARKISIWENFNRDAIVNDFVATLEKK